MSQLAQAAGQQQANPAKMISGRANDFFRVMPSQVDRGVWLRMAESAVAKTPEIYNAAMRDPGALMRAMLECAQLGHIPGTDHYYLTVRQNKIKGEESYKGMIQRILRSGMYQKVVAEVVFDAEIDDFDFNPNGDIDRPTHPISYKVRRRSDITPVMSYAYAVSHDGKASRVAIADERYINKVRKMSRGQVWAQWDEGMYLKTAIRLLIDFVDTSTEDQRLVRQVQAEMPIAIEAPAAAPELEAPVVHQDFIEGEFYEGPASE